MILLKRLRKKKIQTLITFSVFLMVSTLLYVGLSITGENNIFESMMKRANGSDSLMLMDVPSDEEVIINDLLSYSEIDSVHSTPVHMGEISFKVDGEEIEDPVMLSPYDNDEYDRLYTEDKFLLDPDEGEVYINYYFSNSRNLKVGDSIQMSLEGKVFDFTVKGVVVDPHFTSPFISPDRVFVSRNFFEDNQITSNQHLIGINFVDLSQVRTSLYEKLNQKYSSDGIMIIDYNDFRTSHKIVQGVISSILLVVSILIFIISMVVIKNIIHQSIVHKYKEIGVMKAIGYTKSNIQQYFMGQYIFVGTFASILGVFVGFPLRKLINRELANELKVGIENPIDLYLFLTPVLILLMISSTVYLITRKTRKVKPAHAIKYGAPEKKVKNSAFSINRSKLPLTLSLSVKQLLMSGKNVLIIMTVALLMFATMTIYNMGHTMEQSAYFATHLLGIEVGDFSFNLSEIPTDEQIKWLESLDGVDDVNVFGFELGSFTKDDDGRILNISRLMLNGDATKIILEEGRFPRVHNEVVISKMVANQSDKSVGDYIDIDSAGESKSYLITGIQNTVMNSSKTYITLSAGNNHVLEGFIWGYGDADIEALNLIIKEHLGDENSVSRFDGNVKNILSTLESFPTLVRIMLVIFMVICGFVFVNLTIMEVNHGAKSYGIMKAIGFSNYRIQSILILKTMVITCLGTVIGFGFSLMFSNIIYMAIFKLTPFETIGMPIMINISGSLMILLGLLVISFMSAWAPSMRIKNISPKELITE